MDVHYIEAKAYAKENGVDEVLESLKTLFTSEVEFQVEEMGSEGEGGIFTHPLFELKTRLSDQKKVKRFLSKLRNDLGARDYFELKENLSQRVDDKNNLYLRLDKDAAGEGRCSLTCGDCIHVRIKLAVYEKKEGSIINTAEKVLNLG